MGVVLHLPQFGMDYEVEERMLIDRLQIDKSYQRTERQGLIALIAKQFDPQAFGMVCVARRDDKSLWIVDGQQRTKGAKIKGLTEVPAYIVNSTGVAMEADMFRVMNAWRKPVSRADIFRAALQAKVPYAVEINGKVLELGFKIDLDGKVKKAVWPKIQAVGALEEMYVDDGDSGVQRSLETIIACWGHQNEALQMYFLKGVHRFYREYKGTVSVEDMEPRFSKKKAVDIVAAANAEKGMDQKRGFKTPLHVCIYGQLRKLSGKRPPVKGEAVLQE